MTVSQVEDTQTVIGAHKPRERTRTRSASYSFANDGCGPTCSCDIFGLDGHSKIRLTVCANSRRTDCTTAHQRRRVATEDAGSVRVKPQLPHMDRHQTSADIQPTATAMDIKDMSDITTVVGNELKETPKTGRTKTSASSLSAKGSPLTHPVHELLKTEQDYVEHLMILVEASNGLYRFIQNCVETKRQPQVFLWRLAAQPWVPEEKKDIIVRNANEILTFQLNFLAVLEKACTLSTQIKSFAPIAECFIQLGCGFSVYTEYCVQHESSLKVCKELSSKAEWQSFEQGALIEARQLSCQRKLQFQDFLIKPVQRICRYQLLLKEIGKAIPDSPHNQFLLQEALNIMHSVVNSINTEKQKRDVALMTSRFIERLEGDWRLNKRSLQLLGNVIYSGALEMLSLHHINQKVKYYGCFLFSTYMVIVRAKKSTVYEPKHWFPLRKFSIQTVQDGDGYLSNSWLLVSGQHVFEFGASCSQEKHIWIKAIQAAISLLKPDEISEEQYLGQKGDEWPEDMLVSSLQERVKLPSPKLRSRSLANIKDATSAAATWMHMSNKSPQSTVPKQSCSTPNSATNTPRLSQEVLFTNNKTESFHRETRYNAEPFSTDGKDFIDNDPKSVTSISSIPTSCYTPMDSPGRSKFKSPKSARKDSRKAVVDQKLLDVSTQEVLTAKALSAREKDLVASRARRHSFGKGSSKPSAVSADTSEILNTRQKSSSISRRQSHEIIAKKLRPRSNDTPIALAYNQHSDSNTQSHEQSNPTTNIYEHPPSSNELEATNAGSSHGFFEKVIDKFSAISSPHRQRPPAIKTNLPQVVRSNSMKMRSSASPTSSCSNSSAGMDTCSESLDSPRNESILRTERQPDLMAEEDKSKSLAGTSQTERESSKLPSWMRTPVSRRRRRDSKMKQ